MRLQPATLLAVSLLLLACNQKEDTENAKPAAPAEVVQQVPSDTDAPVEEVEVPTEPVKEEQPTVDLPAIEPDEQPEIAPEPPVATDTSSQEMQDLMSITEAAMSGDVNAQYALGKVLKDDAGTTEIRTMAWAWLSLANDAGNAKAPIDLSELAVVMTSEELGIAALTKGQLEQTIVTPTEKSSMEDRDAQRAVDITNLLAAMKKYQQDNAGAVPASVPTGSAREICKQGVVDCGSYVSIQFLVDGGYLPNVPSDPTAKADKNGTRYMLLVTKDSGVTVAALNTETSVVPLTVTE